MRKSNALFGFKENRTSPFNRDEENKAARDQKDDSGFLSLEKIQFRLSNLSLRYVNQSAEKDIQGRVDKLVGQMFSKEKFLLKTQGTGSFQDESWELTVEAESQDDVPIIDAELHFGKNVLAWKGAMNQGTAQGQLRLHGVQLDPYLSLAGLDVGGLPVIQMHGQLSLKENLVHIQDINLSLGQSKMEGKVVLNFAGKRPDIIADITIPLLYGSDLRWLHAKSESIVEQTQEGVSDQEVKEQGSEPRRLIDDDPLPFHHLTGFDFDLKARVQDYEDPGLSGRLLSSLDLDLHLKDGLLKLKHIDVKTSSGQILLMGEINSMASPPTLDIELDILDLQVQDIAELLLSDVKLTKTEDRLQPDKLIGGPLFAELRLKSHGNSPRQILANWDGKFAAAMEDGHLGSLVTEVMHLDLTEAIASWFAKNSKTRLQCFIAEFHLQANGVVRATAILVATEDANLLAQMKLDLLGDTIQGQVETVPKDFSLTNLEAPISVSASLFKPNIKLEKVGLADDNNPRIVLNDYILPGLDVLQNLGEKEGDLMLCPEFAQQLKQQASRSQAK